jgi:hypothetical protein
MPASSVNLAMTWASGAVAGSQLKANPYVWPERAPPQRRE